MISVSSLYNLSSFLLSFSLLSCLILLTLLIAPVRRWIAMQQSQRKVRWLRMDDKTRRRTYLPHDPPMIKQDAELTCHTTLQWVINWYFAEYNRAEFPNCNSHYQPMTNYDLFHQSDHIYLTYYCYY